MEKQSNKAIEGYHKTTRWLHAGLVVGVLFQLGTAIFMQHPDHYKQETSSAHVLEHSSSSTSHHDEQMTHQSIGHQHQALDVSNHMEGAHDEHEKSALGAWLMLAHRTSGVGVALIVLLNLFWAVYRRGSPKHRQISVLFSKAHWVEAIAICKVLPKVILGREPCMKPGNALALIVEVLGLLTMGLMAVTGLTIWWLWPSVEIAVSRNAELIMQLHSNFSVLLIIYLLGHVSMALLHAYRGDAVFKRISPFG